MVGSSETTAGRVGAAGLVGHAASGICAVTTALLPAFRAGPGA